MSDAGHDIEDGHIRELYERAKRGDVAARSQLQSLDPHLGDQKAPADYQRLSTRDRDVIRALELLELFDTERRDGDNAREIKRK